MEWQAITAGVRASSSDASGPWSYELESPGMHFQVVDNKMELTMQLQGRTVEVPAVMPAVAVTLAKPAFTDAGAGHDERLLGS